MKKLLISSMKFFCLSAMKFFFLRLDRFIQFLDTSSVIIGLEFVLSNLRLTVSEDLLPLSVQKSPNLCEFRVLFLTCFNNGLPRWLRPFLATILANPILAKISVLGAVPKGGAPKGAMLGVISLNLGCLTNRGCSWVSCTVQQLTPLVYGDCPHANSPWSPLAPCLSWRETVTQPSPQEMGAFLHRGFAALGRVRQGQ